MTRTPLLDVLRAREPDRRPIWLMRQAGRYLPEYREVRTKAGSFLELCYNPELAREVTLQPLRRYDLDAAILFSDILVVPHAMGLRLEFVEGEGPRLETVSDLSSVQSLKSGIGSQQFGRVCETVGLVANTLDPKIGFIGFCGAPWTVGSYMIEGGGSDRKRALAAAAANPAWFGLLLERLVESSVSYLLGQIAAGAQVVQIFDSWAGDVPERDRQRVVVEPIAAIVRGVRKAYPDFPVIVFARGVGMSHGVIARGTEATAVGVEQDIALPAVLAALPEHVAVQGNLAPDILLESDDVIRQETERVLVGVVKRRHVFNLGHGITPSVRPDDVHVLIDAVRKHDEALAHV
jgi:uroporphyrinogen decarboxylase